MNKNSKKIFLITLFIILLLVTFLFGTTFAYITVLIKNDTETIKIEGTMEDTGNVVLKSNNNDLFLNLSSVKMMNKGKDVEYYATTTGDPSETKNDVSIAEIDITGNNTINCTYKLIGEIDGKNNMYDAFKTMENASQGQLVLILNGKEYDLYNTSFPLTINGDTGNINNKTNTDIKASFKLVNKKDVDQTKLAGTDLTITFNIEEFKCKIVG